MDATVARTTCEPIAKPDCAVTELISALAEHRRRALGVECLVPAVHSEWDRYIFLHPDGTFFHQTGWMNAIRESFGHEPHYLIARRGSRIAGVLPLFHVRSRLGGSMLISVPYAVAGGMLADDDDARAVLSLAMLDVARDCHAPVIDLRCERAELQPVPYERGSDKYHCSVSSADVVQGGDVDNSHRRGWRVVEQSGHVTFKRSLPDSADDVLGWLPRKARAAARNGECKFGLTVDFGRDYLPIVWRLYCRNMRRLASISYPLRFFETLAAQHPADIHVQVVCHQDRIIAGLLSFRFGDTFLPYFVGCDERYNHLQTNNYLYMTAMRRAVEIGCRVFDFGRTRVNNRGSFDFKRFHGFEPTPVAYQTWIAPGADAPSLSPDSPRYRLARRFWPRLPLALCNGLSRVLAKHIPG